LAERLTVEVPPPVSPDLSAAALLHRLATLSGDETWLQFTRWLVDRDPVKAADEVLAAACEATPAMRVAAVDMVGGLGELALPAWRRAVDDPMLAPHARSVLADLNDTYGDEDDDDAARPKLSGADRRWLVVEFALAALATDGPEEAYHVLREGDCVDAVLASGHPDAALLRDGLAELVSAGGPSVPTYQLKIALTRIRPPVWRRVRLPATATLDVLHHVIQATFDWDDDHLHLFTVDGRRYADPFHGPDDCADESLVRLGRLLPRAGGAMTYVYDLGDWWEHRITVERIMATAEPEETAVCVGGQGDAPVEDWYPDCGRDPTPFDVAGINRRLGSAGGK
jgi:hypothetical protein